MNDFMLTGRIALINGGSRGIGEAVGRAFAKAGATVILSSRKQEGVDAVADSIRAEGGNAAAKACHAAKADQVDTLFEFIASEYGQLDILVNNAATNPYFGPILEAPEAAFDKTFDVNCKGYFLMAQRAARMMAARQSGSIINISSIEGLHPSPMMGVYSMTKAAVIMLTKALARELGGANVRSNCICPGLTETRFAKVLIDTPEIHDRFTASAAMGRHAQPEEITGAALYFASDASSCTTGAVLTCDCGSAI